MRNYKKLMSFILVMGLTVAVLTACGNEDAVEGVEAVEITEAENVDDEENTDTDVSSVEADDTVDASEMKDLFDYYGADIEHVATDLTDLQLDDSYKTADGTTEISGPTDSMEKMSDGLALAGPFFTVNNEGSVVGISYGGKNYSVCGITVGSPMSAAAEIAKSHGFTFADVEIAHGTAKYVAIYENDNMQLCITSDAEGEFGVTEESDVTGNVDSILLIAE